MKKIFLFCLVSLLFGACKHPPNELTKDCLEEMRTKYKLSEYSGGPIPDCKSFLVRYEWKGEQYFSLQNYCLYQAVNAFDCEGNTVNSKEFWDEAVYKGIMGIAN